MKDKTRTGRLNLKLAMLVAVIAVTTISAGGIIWERIAIAHRRESLTAIGVSVHETAEQPKWRVLLLGDDWPSYARSVAIFGGQTEDADLAQLAAMKNLRFLNLTASKVTDAGMVHLLNLSHLDTLILKATLVSDAGLEHLKSLEELTLLDIMNSRVTEAGAADFRKARPTCLVSRVTD